MYQIQQTIERSKSLTNIRGWLSWGIASAFVFYQFLLQASTSVMVPDLARDFNIDIARVGFLSACFFYPYLLLQMPAGTLVDRYGARLVLTIGMVGCAISCWLFATANSALIAELSRMLMGVMTATAVVGSLYLASNWFPLERFALLAGLTEMLGMLGGAVGQNILAFAVESIGWHGTILACAVVGIVLAALTVSFVANSPPGKEIIHHQRKNVLHEFWQVLRLPQVWVNSLFGGLIFAIITGFAALWSVPFLMKLYNIPLTTAAAASSMVFWGAALGGPFAGWLSAIFPRRRIIMQIGALAVLVLCLILFYWPYIPLSVMFIGLLALGFFSGVYVLMFPIVCEAVPVNLRGTAMGFTNMVGILFGAPIMQPLIGGLLQLQQGQQSLATSFTVQQYQIAFSVLPLGVLLAFVFTFFIHERKKHTHA